MARFKMYQPTSNASKPKNQKWDKHARFSGGHDAACRALLPEEELVRQKNEGRRKRPKAQRIGVYRAATFGLPKEERLASDAAYLMNIGKAKDMDEALEKAAENYRG